MKTTGITRRIDELGRIVIPKEIRKNMHLKTGELLEIFLEDETINLKKHSIIDKNQEFLQYYVEVLANKLSAEIYITTLSDIAFSSEEKIIGEKLSSKLENLITNNVNLSDINLVNLTDDKKIDNSHIYSLRPNGDLSGLLIISYNSNNHANYDELIKFTTSFFEKYFENI